MKMAGLYVRVSSLVDISRHEVKSEFEPHEIRNQHASPCEESLGSSPEEWNDTEHSEFYIS